jgi:eukaryotic-like serine/threonine-protein kinase
MDPDELIGASLGNYRVTSKLGQGGMGAVYKAEHPVLGRPAAIKVLLAELSQRKDLIQRFFHEARTTAQLRHPTMVDVYDYGTTADGRAYLVMDFLDGESLETRVRTRNTLPWQTALQITRQIALGVSVAHAEQIVHRDLKPDNIFLLPAIAGNPEERVKILDFGIAKLGRSSGEAAMTRAGMLIGTPLYMSPEQCRGAHEVDHRADIYSLGCIVFTMLAGRPPFLSHAAGELIGLHQHAAPPTLASLGLKVPDTVEHLVAAMLAKAPESRVQSMAGVADAVDAILRGEARVVPAVPGNALAGGTLMLSTDGASGTKLLDAPPVALAGGTNLLPDSVRLSTLSGAAVATDAAPKRRSSRTGVVVGLVAGALVVGGGAATLMMGRPGAGPPRTAGVSDPGVTSGTAAPLPPTVSVERTAPAHPVIPPAPPVAPTAPAAAAEQPAAGAPGTAPAVTPASRKQGRKRNAASPPTAASPLAPNPYPVLPAAPAPATTGAAPGEQPAPAADPATNKSGKTVYKGTKLNLETQAPY